VQYAIAASGATSVAVEASLQLAQAAVELLARELLRQASIDTQVPASLPQLRQYQQQR